MPKVLLFLCLFVTLTFLPTHGFAQTQEDFQNKYTEIFQQASDKKKAFTIAKEAYQMVEKQPALQTYINYYLLKSIFENQAPDTAYAKICSEKADKLIRAEVGLQKNKIDYGSDSMNLWYNEIYKNLYETSDPENASKAVAFLEKYASYKTYPNYTGIAYAYERNGDLTNAKKYYEHSLTLVTDDQKEYFSYITYVLFLCKYGDYLKAEEFIRKMETLATTATEIFRESYKNEAISAHALYSFYTGDFESYLYYSNVQAVVLNKVYEKNKLPCANLTHNYLTNTAIASEQLKNYAEAEKKWKSRDSVFTRWINCQNELYPNLKMYDVSMYPVFMYKRGKEKLITQPASYYIEQTNAYYNSFSKYADVSTQYYKATQLAFLKSPDYKASFIPVLNKIRVTKDYRESTKPFADFAYFAMRDNDYATANSQYKELFTLNANWINDIIFTFGERAFVTYYNAKLREGYENFHSYVKLAIDNKLNNYEELASIDYNNLLFTKSISLQGTKKRKEAFLKNNNPEINKLYTNWLDKKQQLIRQYFKTSEPAMEQNKIATTQADNLLQLQTEVTDMENRLAVQSKDFKKLLTITPPDWKQIQQKLQPDEAAIEIVRFQWRNQVYYSDSSYYAAYILTATGSPQVIYLPASPIDLDDKLYKKYKSNIQFKTSDKESYNHYWKPIGNALTGITKVYFSPDGIYHLINLATLQNPTTGKFVLDEINIQLTTSTNDIVSTSTPNNNNTAVLLGRPSYNNSSKTSTLNSSETRAFVNNFKNQNISDLPGTEAEVNSIAVEMNKQSYSVTTYLKEEAAEDKLYTLNSPEILHIATHGYWAGSNNSTEGFRLFNAMANAGLLLSGVVNYYNTNPYPNTYDGVLTAYEAQNLNLNNTSLVVLSACETTLGYLDAGEGVYGLQRAFRAAGAASTITSLWKVDDAATKDFMIAFYQQYLTTKNKSQAFLFAQKTIKEKYLHPYYWGAFILTGK
jgi:CHAT domain-containing protein